MNSKNTSQIIEKKALLRHQAKRERAMLASDMRAECSQQIAHGFMSGLTFGTQSKIALYWPIGDEVDCRGLISLLAEQGVQVGLPSIVGRDQPLVFRLFSGEENLICAQFGTKEPDRRSPVIVPDIIALPLLAFDKTGARLGYGGGFYDRTIAQMKVRPTLIGLAFGAQELDFVPTSTHDIGLDMVITQTGMRRFNNEGPGH